MNTFVYVGAYISVFLLSWVIYQFSSRESATYGAILILLISAIVHLVFTYNMWSAINDGKTSITPGKAVGFHFIPIFNILWAGLNFMTFFGAYNSFIERNRISALKLSNGLPFAYFLYSLFVASGFIYAPKIVWMFAAVQFVFHIVLVIKTCGAINYLTDSGEIMATESITLNL